MRKTKQNYILWSQTWKMRVQISIGQVLIDKCHVGSFIAISDKVSQVSMMNSEEKLNL